MRQLVVIIVLLLAMLGLKAIGLTDSTGFDSILLASIGFVMLAAFSAAEFAGNFTLPRVTGYILTGIILGPQVLNILSNSVVSDIKMFSTLALGLIALHAGLEFHLGSLRKILKALTLTIFLKLITLFIFVGGGTFLILSNTSLLVLDSTGMQIALSLVIAALSVGTSPAIALAVISENKSQGRMSDLVMGAAILKDVVVVLTLAICVTISKSLVDPSKALDLSVLTGLGLEIAYSLLFGAFLGGLLIVYLKYIKVEMLLFVAVVILATAEISKALHLELLLVFIMAGMVVRNFSKYEHDLLHPLEKVALPVFIIFFTNAGAALNLTAISLILPLALIVCCLRACSFYVSSYFGSKWAGESTLIAKNAWLGYLPQAGVTLGLVGIAGSQLPEISQAIDNVGMGMVAINLLLGPITLRMSLKNCGDIKLEEAEDTPVKNRVGAAEVVDVGAREFHYKIIKNEKLQKELQLIIEKIEQESIQFVTAKLAHPAKGILRELLDSKKANFRSTQFVEKYIQANQTIAANGEYIIELAKFVERLLSNTRHVYTVPFDDELLRWQALDSSTMKLKKVGFRIKRIFFLGSRYKERDVLFQSVLKRNLLPAMAGVSLALVNNWYILCYQLIDEMRKLIVDSESESNNIEVDFSRYALEKIDEIEKQIIDQIKHSINQELRLLSLELQQVNSPYLTADMVRYSHVEPQVRATLNETQSCVAVWKKKQPAIYNTLRVHSHFSKIDRAIESSLELRCYSGLKSARSLISNSLASIKRIIASSTQKIQSLEGEELASEVQKLDIHLQKEVNSIRGQHHSLGNYRLLNRDIATKLSEIVEIEKDIAIIAHKSLGLNTSDPREIQTVTINISHSLNQHILSEFLPNLESQLEKLSGLSRQVSGDLDDALQVLEYSFDSYRDHHLEDKKNATDSLLQVVEKCNDQIDVIEKETLDFLNASEEEIKKWAHQSTEEIWEALTKEGFVGSAGQKIAGLKGVIQFNIFGFLNYVEKKYKTASGYFKRLASTLEESDTAKELRKKIEDNSLDSDIIHRYVDESYLSPYSVEFNKLYNRLFSLDPLQDTRFQSAHNSEYQRLLESRSSAKKILIVGDPGSGKTSFLNVYQLQNFGSRLIRLDREIWGEEESLVGALADSLSCKKRKQDILFKLKAQKTAILVDNLDYWWQCDQIREMKEFFEIIVESSMSTSWVATMGVANFTLFNECFELRSIFTEVTNFKPLDYSSLKTCILERHKLSGQDVSYPVPRFLSSIQRIWRGGDEELFFRVLLEQSSGNLQEALFLWMRSISSIRSESIRVSLKKLLLGDLGFLKSFKPLSVLLLKDLYRFGPRSADLLAIEVGGELKSVQRELASLENAGILDVKNKTRKIYQIQPRLVFKVGEQMKQMKVL